jgi:circadian clock protein KaiC
MVSGTAGTGKTTIANHFAAASCARGEKCLYLAFEESPQQIIRNMGSVGVRLEPAVRKGLLRIDAARPTAFGLERHLTTIHRALSEFAPRTVIVDPITSFLSAASPRDARAMLTRLVDFLKQQQITAVFTSLAGGGGDPTETEIGLSSIVDTWLLLRDVELAGERNRTLHILKSRGMAHSNQLREYLLGAGGFEIRDSYLGPEGVLTGSARVVQEARELAAKVAREQHLEGQRLSLDRKRRALEDHIARLRLEFEAEESAAQHAISQEVERERVLSRDRDAMARSRKAGDDGGRERRRRSNGKGARP